MKDQLEDLAVQLYEINAIKFGSFKTKIGLHTPVYFDLRVIVSHPQLMKSISSMLWKFYNGNKNISQICGVPYTALPIATLISVESNIPMLIRRKEAKSYGTKKLIEGQFKCGETCVIIEDVVTSGSSVIDTAKDLINEGLKVTNAFVILDREQGGKKNLKDNGIEMQSLFTMTNLMGHLLAAGKVTSAMVLDINNYLKANHVDLQKNTLQTTKNRLKLSFTDRAKSAQNPAAAKLFETMAMKQTTLCLAADLTSSRAILDLAELAGPHIAVLKTHIDAVDDFTGDFIKRLRDLAKTHNFFIMEDRKFGDIGHTVSLQYKNGIYKIAEWADFVTVHSAPGPGIISGLQDGLKYIHEHRGIFLVTEMSSAGALTTGEYVAKSMSLASTSNLVAGVVCQSNVFEDAGLVQLTPGVRLSESSDCLGQQYNTPESVVNSGADLAVVGRGITQAEDKLTTVIRYKQKLWQAYIQRISS